jgi:hypothetical protein
MKNTRLKIAWSVYGKLEGEKYSIFLGIIESQREYHELIEEYRNVFGTSIKFRALVASKKEYAAEKAKAFVTLLKALNAPIVNVFVNTLQITGR